MLAEFEQFPYLCRTQITENYTEHMEGGVRKIVEVRKGSFLFFIFIFFGYFFGVPKTLAP